MCVNRFDEETKSAFLDLYSKVDADVTIPSESTEDEDESTEVEDESTEVEEKPTANLILNEDNSASEVTSLGMHSYSNSKDQETPF